MLYLNEPYVEFPPARPTANLLHSICTESRHRLRYPPGYFPRSGFSHLRRCGKAVDRVESWYTECCTSQTMENNHVLCCAEQAVSRALPFILLLVFAENKKIICVGGRGSDGQVWTYFTLSYSGNKLSPPSARRNTPPWPLHTFVAPRREKRCGRVSTATPPTPTTRWGRTTLPRCNLWSTASPSTPITVRECLIGLWRELALSGNFLFSGCRNTSLSMWGISTFPFSQAVILCQVIWKLHSKKYIKKKDDDVLLYDKLWVTTI